MDLCSVEINETTREVKDGDLVSKAPTFSLDKKLKKRIQIVVWSTRQHVREVGPSGKRVSRSLKIISNVNVFLNSE